MKTLKKLSVLLVAVLMVVTLAACGSNAGKYYITSMTQNGQTIDIAEQAKAANIDASQFYIELKDDKTAVVNVTGYNGTGTWDDKVITSDGDSVAYTVENDVLTISKDGTTMTAKKQ